MKILIAEDEPVTQRILEKMVSDSGHQPTVVGDGVKATQILELEHPQMAILDWNLPGMDGLEVCRRVREQDGIKQPYIIFVTVRRDKADIVACLDEGADDYITKPFHEEELAARIRAGERILKLRDQVVQAERGRVLVETAGAAAHEINQPLTALMATAEMMLQLDAKEDEERRKLQTILNAASTISEIVKKMLRLRSYVTKPYVGASQIVDFDASSQ